MTNMKAEEQSFKHQGVFCPYFPILLMGWVWAWWWKSQCHVGQLRWKTHSENGKEVRERSCHGSQTVPSSVTRARKIYSLVFNYLQLKTIMMVDLGVNWRWINQEPFLGVPAKTDWGGSSSRVGSSLVQAWGRSSAAFYRPPSLPASTCIYSMVTAAAVIRTQLL